MQFQALAPKNFGSRGIGYGQHLNAGTGPMTDSERSYVTDEDYSRIMNETGKYWRPGGPGERGSHLTCERNIRRLLNEMIEREVEKAIKIIQRVERQAKVPMAHPNG